MQPDDLITTERVGLVVYRLLVLGERGTTTEIGEWVGMSRWGAYEMLNKLVRVLPLTSVDGCWQSTHDEMIR